jgi:DNA-binding MarR family transcriptional regulator
LRLRTIPHSIHRQHRHPTISPEKQTAVSMPLSNRSPQSASTAVSWFELAQRLECCARTVGSALRDALRQVQSPWDHRDVALLLLCREGPPEGVCQSDLARQLGLSPAQVSGMVECLRAAETLVSHRAASDRRRQLWRLSNNGVGQLESLLAALQPWAVSMNQHATNDALQIADRLQQLAGAVIGDAPQRSRFDRAQGDAA